MSLVEGSVTRLAGRREYVLVGLTAAFPAADTCQSSNRTLLKIGKLFTAKSYRLGRGVHAAHTSSSVT